MFIGSFYYNDLIMYERELFRVIGVNSDINNLVELNMVDITYKDFCEVNHVTGEKRIKKTIGKRVVLIEKYTTDILGNLYKAPLPKKPQLVFKRGEL